LSIFINDNLVAIEYLQPPSRPTVKVTTALSMSDPIAENLIDAAIQSTGHNIEA